MADFLGLLEVYNQELTSFMQQVGSLEYPKEACGLVVSIGSKSVPFACENSAEFPLIDFMISAEEYSRIADMGEIIACWHTHPNLTKEPSDADRAGCENSGIPWFIMSVNKAGTEFVFDGPLLLEPCGFEMSYIERPYVFGVFDCYTLLCDYYKRELDITLSKDYPYVYDFGKKGMNLFVEHFKKENFVRLMNDEIAEVGDVFLLQTGGTVTNHIAIYIGDDMILHHCHGRLSKRDVYGGYWLKHTTHHLRHESKC